MWQFAIIIYHYRPGSWNVRQEGGIQVAQVIQSDMPPPPQIDRLMERSKTEMVAPPPLVVDKMNDNIRSLEEVKTNTLTYKLNWCVK